MGSPVGLDIPDIGCMLYSAGFRRFISLAVLNLSERIVTSTPTQIPDAVKIPDLIPSPVSTQLTPPLLLSENVASDPPVAVGNAASPAVTKSLYSVAADNIPVKEILQTIARDAQAQVSYVGDIEGHITLNAFNQPLDFILQQISRQAPVRYEVHGERFLILEDKPVIRSYEVDYLNMQRLSESRVDVATQIGSMSTSIDGNVSAQIGNYGCQLPGVSAAYSVSRSNPKVAVKAFL